MKCLTNQEMKHVDFSAINKYHLPGKLLMENAGRAIVDEIVADVKKNDRIVVAVGPGNNGGDGFVVARELKNRGYHVAVVQTVSEDKIKGDAYLHLNIMKPFGVEIVNDFETAARYLHEATIIVDAIFGTGYTGPMRQPISHYVTLMNQMTVPIYSIDVPSGVSEKVDSMSEVIQATKTISIEAPKVTAYIESTAPYYGDLVIVSIGIPNKELNKINRIVWQKKDLLDTLKKREKFGHKGIYGHVLLMGGTVDMPGAIQLSAIAALKSGVGLVTVMTDQDVYPYLHLPYEVMYKSNDALTSDILNHYQAVGVGMGFGVTDEKRRMFKQIIETTAPLLIDADGLTLLAKDIELLQCRKGPTVLTPHPKEFSRLTGLTVNEIKNNPFAITASFAKKHGVYLVLKGAYTIITAPTGKQVINTTGNSGLSKGGSGDILSGLISVRMMQDDTMLAGISNAVYLHGLASDEAVKDTFTAYDLTPTDVVETLTKAYRTFIE